MMKLLVTIREFKNNLLYIFKKREIIRLIAFTLIFALLGGIDPVLSEEAEAAEANASENVINKEAADSGMEGYRLIPITVMGIYIPALFIADYLGENQDRLQDIAFAARTRKTDKKAAIDAGETKASAKDSKTGKVAYITFDDGLDSKVTPQILDVLKKYEIKATFFIIGNTVEKNKAVLKRMVEEGHNIGNHTYTHKKGIIYTDVNKFSEELGRTSKAIYSAVGIRTKLFRPPYGAPYIRGKDYKAALSDYKIVLWNVDSMDSRVKDITSSTIVETVKKQLKSKQKANILFHSTASRTETVKALPEIIEYLIDNGYSISRLE